MGNLLLLLIGVLVIALAISVILNKSVVSSAFSLISLMVLLGAVYAMIGVHFVAAIQLIVYAGAIMVLFIFAIMLMNSNEMRTDVALKSPLTIFSILSSLVLSIVLVSLFKAPFAPLENVEKGPFTNEVVQSQGGNLIALSKLLFSQYFLHFEMISLVLLVALVGALTVAKRKVS